MLHLFCGSLAEGETRVDLRDTGAANLIGDFQKVQIPQIHLSAFADPPYTQEFSNQWGVKCPKPSFRVPQ